MSVAYGVSLITPTPELEMYRVESEEYRGHEIEVYHDSDAESPREWQEAFDTMVCFHGKYDLGDSHTFASPEELQEYVNTSEEVLAWRSLYLYDHSGLSMNTSGFSCPWDSGQVGIIFVTREQAFDKAGWRPDQPDLMERLEACIQGAVSEYSDYLAGEVYYIKVTAPDGEMLDGCGGFIGEDGKSYGIQEMRDYVDRTLTEE